MPYRITLIGGGSSMFTPHLVALCIRSAALRGSTIVLMDINEERLRLMDTLCKLMIEAYEADLRIESTTDRRAAVTGTDFVIAAIAVGGFPAWEKDLEIPAKYGIFHPIGDTAGPGGIMRTLRHTVPLAAVAEDVAAVAPNAVIFNYTNPVPPLCRLMEWKGRAPVVGLCTNSMLPRDPDFMSALVGVEPGELVLPPLVGGLNHCTAIVELKFRDGRDALPRIREEVDQPVIRWGLDTYGVVPYAWPHWVEFFPSLCRLEEGSKYTGRFQSLCMKYGSPVHDMDVETDRGRQWDALMRKWVSREEPVRLEDLPEFETVQIVEILEALVEDRNEVHCLNVPNQGTIDNLPADCYVEVCCLVNRYGARPLHVGPLPEALAAHLRLHIEVQKLAVEAALTGSRRTALQAFTLDPFVSSLLTPEDTERFLEEMLAAHRAYLPQFV